jgi:hypothetical protein
MTTIRCHASFLGITFGTACTLAACFGPPFTLRAPATESGEGGAGGHGGTSSAGGGQAGHGGTGGDDGTTLVIQDNAGVPVSGITVVVNDEIGAVVVVTETGGDGRAEITIPNAGSVSVFSTVEVALHVHTLVDPPPGLTIPVIIGRPAGALPEKTLYQAIVVGEPPGTDHVYIWSTCDVGLSDMVFDNAQCLDASAIDFLGVAFDVDDNAIAWGLTPNQPTSPGGDAIFVPLDVTETAFHTLNATITGTLPSTSYAGVTPGADLSVASWITLPSPLASPPLVVTHRVPAVPGMGYRVHEFASSWSDAASPMTRIERDRFYTVLPALTTFAVSSMAPLSVNPLGLADPVHPELTWSVAGGERGDQGTLTMSWGSGVVVVTYEAVFAPEHTTSFRVPDIPPELSSYAPSPTTTFGKSVSVWYDDLESVEGYGDVLDGAPPVDGLGRIRSGAYLTLP